MNVVILNGNPEPDNAGFDGYVHDLGSQLVDKQHTVDVLTVRDMDFRYCIGCFGCWVKTPGQCVTKDASHDSDRRIINSDLVLLASPLIMGFVSATLKRAQDKFIGLVHPYITLVEGECHHIKRYDRYPRLAVLVEREADTDDEDLAIVKDIYSRTSLNFKTTLGLFCTTKTPAAEVADEIDRL